MPSRKGRGEQRSPAVGESIFTLRSVYDYVNNQFIKSIPASSIRELPTNYMYAVAFIVHAATLGLFVSFFTISFSNATTEKFLSLQSDAGTCNQVLKSWSGSYLADYYGYWEGQTNFSYANALYSFQVNNWLTNLSNYQQVCGDLLLSDLVDLGQLTSVQNLAQNIIVWTSYAIYYSDGDTNQYFQLVGSPSVIFDAPYQYGSVGNYGGDCGVESLTSFDPATNIMQISFEHSEFIADPVCASTIDPSLAGYNAAFQGNRFAMEYDVRSMVIAAAVNAKNIFLNINPIPNTGALYHVGARYYAVGEFYATKYPGMAPIVCVDNATAYAYTDDDNFDDDGDGQYEQFFCGLNINDRVFAIPLLNSFGANASFPAYCSCDDDTGYSKECNDFDFLSGFLLFNQATPELAAEALVEFMLHTKSSRNVTRLAYDAMYAAASVGIDPEADAYFQTASFRASAYDFCSVSLGNCSIVSINTFAPDSYAISSYYYQLTNGSCTDSITSPYFNRLVDTPPVQLTENYYECKATFWDAFVTALGISTGTASALLPLIVILCVSTVIFCNRSAGRLPYRMYDKREREEVLDVMALELLLLRDKKITPSPTQQEIMRHTNKDGTIRPGEPHVVVLQQLLEELRSHVRNNGGVVESTAEHCGAHHLDRAVDLDAVERIAEFDVESSAVNVLHAKGDADAAHEVEMQERSAPSAATSSTLPLVARLTPQAPSKESQSACNVPLTVHTVKCSAGPLVGRSLVLETCAVSPSMIFAIFPRVVFVAASPGRIRCVEAMLPPHLHPTAQVMQAVVVFRLNKDFYHSNSSAIDADMLSLDADGDDGDAASGVGGGTSVAQSILGQLTLSRKGMVSISLGPEGDFMKSEVYVLNRCSFCFDVSSR